MKGKTKSILAWAGFTSGEICHQPTDDGYIVPARQFEIFTTRKSARCRYQDVRRVLITVVPGKRL